MSETAAASDSPLTQDDRFAANPLVMSCRVGDDIVLFDSAQGRYYGLNEVGAAVFELAGEGRSLGEIHTLLAARYDVDPNTLWADVVAFSTRVVTLGALRRT